MTGLLDLSFDGQTFCGDGKAIRSQLYSLLHIRRSRIKQLSSVGWNRIHTEYERLIGCPPSGAYVQPTSRECRVDYFCPFCWMRRVTATVYDRVAWAYYNTNQLQSPPSPVRFLDLVLLRRQRTLDLRDYSDPKRIFFDARDLAKLVHQDRLQYLSLGTVSLATLQPALDHTENSVLTESFLSLVVPGSELSDLCEEQGLTKRRMRCGQVQPYLLADIVGEFCEYPVGFIKGSSSVTHSILNIRSRKRVGGQRTPSALEFWGYLRQYPIFKFDAKCRTAYQENYTDAIKPNASIALGGISP